MWKRKIIHRNGSGTITLNRKMMEDAGWNGAESVSVEIGPGGVVTMRPSMGGAIASIIGIDCFSWEDVEYVGKCMRELGYVPGVNGPKAGEVEAAAQEEEA